MRYSGTRCEIAKIRKILNETYGLNYFSVKDANFMLDKICEALVVDEKSNGWIPVSERLPEDGTYITTLDGELVGQKEPFTGMCGIENAQTLSTKVCCKHCEVTMKRNFKGSKEIKELLVKLIANEWNRRYKDEIN